MESWNSNTFAFQMILVLDTFHIRSRPFLCHFPPLQLPSPTLATLLAAARSAGSRTATTSQRPWPAPAPSGAPPPGVQWQKPGWWHRPWEAAKLGSLERWRSSKEMILMTSIDIPLSSADTWGIMVFMNWQVHGGWRWYWYIPLILSRPLNIPAAWTSEDSLTCSKDHQGRRHKCCWRRTCLVPWLWPPGGSHKSHQMVLSILKESKECTQQNLVHVEPGTFSIRFTSLRFPHAFLALSTAVFLQNLSSWR